MARPESFVVYDILRTWGAHPQMRIWRQNTGRVKIDGRWIAFGIPGQADITGVVGNIGRRIEIECKTEIGRQSTEQKTFQEMIERFGGLYLLVRSLEELDAALAARGITR